MKENLIVIISQRISNPKCVINVNKNLNSFSVGSIIKYFKIKQGKYIRRTTHGLKIFLNFLKNIFLKKYQSTNKEYILLSIVGVDYNIAVLKKHLKFFLNDKNVIGVYNLMNLKISFNKKRERKLSL